MKNKLISLLVLTTLLIVPIGCVTNQTQRPPEEVIVDFIKPLVTVACTAVLESSVNASERVEIAKQIFDVSKIVESLSSGIAPTPEELSIVLQRFFPEGAKYVNFVTALKDIYATEFNKIGGDTKLAIKYLNQIAAGCKESASNYLPKP